MRVGLLMEFFWVRQVCKNEHAAVLLNVTFSINYSKMTSFCRHSFSVTAVSLPQITREFFSSLPDVASQRRLVSCLLSVETTTKCSTVSTAVRTCLKQVIHCIGVVDDKTDERCEWCDRMWTIDVLEEWWWLMLLGILILLNVLKCGL